MDSSKQIIMYLEELAQVLHNLGVTVQFHILVTGGAYMILQQQRRSTEDIDFALLTSQSEVKPNTVFHATVQRGEIASRASLVPGATAFKEAIGTIAARYNLPLDWMNDEAAVYLYDDAPGADVYLWQSFGDILFVYLPTMEYVFATKIAAYRRKDFKDIQILMSELGIRSLEDAWGVVDKFLLPDAQQFWEVEKKLKRLFR